MDSVLQKTVASLERAIKFNPNNIELMSSLAESYIRMGRLDSGTIELCEKVLDKYPDNSVLQQAQTVAFVIEQTDQIDAGLAAGKDPPPAVDILSSVGILEEFLEEIKDSCSVWLALARLGLLAGCYEKTLGAIEQIKRLDPSELAGLRRTIDWLASNAPPEGTDWPTLIRLFETLGELSLVIRLLEHVYDDEVEREQTGRLLLDRYLARYDADHPNEVPEQIRPRFFEMLLDYGERDVVSTWLSNAAMFGWQIHNYSKIFIHDLLGNNQLGEAFEILRRMAIDDEVRDLLNRIAEEYERQDKVDEAVEILRYINDHELSESVVDQRREADLAREMELSLAELNLKNGRVNGALAKFVSALCMADTVEDSIVERIEEILETGAQIEANPILRLSAYFRARSDFPKTVYFLNHILDSDPDHRDALYELSDVFGDILGSEPDNPPLRLEMGRVKQRLGQHKDAIEEFKSAMDAPGQADTVNRLLARSYLETGQSREALARYQDVTLAEEDLDGVYKVHAKLVEADDLRPAIIALELIMRVRADFRDAAERLREIEDRITGSGTAGGLGIGTGPTHPGDEKMRELVGDMAVGRYRHIEKIGSGGMGVVYKVVDLKHQKIVAMKVLRDALGGNSKALDRFFREARIAASIHHRNIVEIFDFNISSLDGQSYICMELVDGPSLRELSDKHYENTVSTSIDFITEMLYYTTQLFDALEATHVKGIVHRDIKPDNIMIDQAGTVKITDFGIVHVDEATFTPTGAMLGTPRYMSPEQVTGGRVDGRSDIYSVGILMFELLTGAPPFVTGDISYQQVNKKPVHPRKINPIIPQSLSNFIIKSLEKDPDARFGSAKEAKIALAEILETLGGCAKFNSRTVVGDVVASEDAGPDSGLGESDDIDVSDAPAGAPDAAAQEGNGTRDGSHASVDSWGMGDSVDSSSVSAGASAAAAPGEPPTPHDFTPTGTQVLPPPDPPISSELLADLDLDLDSCVPGEDNPPASSEPPSVIQLDLRKPILDDPEDSSGSSSNLDFGFDFPAG